MMSGTDTITLQQKRMNQGAHTCLRMITTSFKTFTGDNDIFTITKTKHNGISKTRLVSETSTSVNSDFYFDERQK